MVVCKDFEVRSAFEIVSPSLKAVHNGQELFLMYWIIELGRNKFARLKGNWVPMVIIA
jgi:hypothetical protein